MKVLISGSRKWLAQAPIERVLRQLPPDTTVIHGAAKGADRIAGFVAELCGFPVREYPALADGRQWPWAGPVRNGVMLKEEHPSPDGLFIDKAFLFHHDPNLGKGTRDMWERLVAASPAIEIEIFIERGR